MSLAYIQVQPSTRVWVASRLPCLRSQSAPDLRGITLVDWKKMAIIRLCPCPPCLGSRAFMS